MITWAADRRSTRIDALYATIAVLGGVVLYFVGAYGSGFFPEDGDQPLWLRIGPLLLGAFSVFLRRGMPLTSLILGTAAFAADFLMGPSVALFVIFQDNLYSATAYGPRRTQWWLNGFAVTIALGCGIWLGVASDSFRWGFLVALIVIGLSTTPVLTGVIVRLYRQRLAEAKEHARQLARLAELDRRGAVNAERTRMARELHDAVANQFGAIAMQTAALISRGDLDEATRQTVLHTIRDSSLRGLAELRGMIELLRAPGEGADAPVSHRLDEAEALAASVPGLKVDLKVTGTPEELPAAVDLAGYRILQESLANAAKYGTGVAEAVIDYAEAVTITVDSPIGTVTPGADSGGAGLVGMSERTQLLGGTFAAGPLGHPQGTVWRMRAVLPFSREEK
ncbi:two-component sensor histidine kinase [Actinorhabdospora filicis]|uniref:histidine kinase n=1 Tax=Actinorhabdospora filicis TaxID=1785913 RepID=A0A9W6SWP9_9ACTN|nr:histidine kinase [Actinorhabdospora filicis]GLZ82106.1 two-component sensor histidine kinase [Actinorhabdospora filicis]